MRYDGSDVCLRQKWSIEHGSYSCFCKLTSLCAAPASMRRDHDEIYLLLELSVLALMRQIILRFLAESVCCESRRLHHPAGIGFHTHHRPVAFADFLIGLAHFAEPTVGLASGFSMNKRVSEWTTRATPGTCRTTNECDDESLKRPIAD